MSASGLNFALPVANLMSHERRLTICLILSPENLGRSASATPPEAPPAAASSLTSDASSTSATG